MPWVTWGLKCLSVHPSLAQSASLGFPMESFGETLPELQRALESWRALDGKQEPCKGTGWSSAAPGTMLAGGRR